jgi:iron(III) transport system ATP-binding protein
MSLLEVNALSKTYRGNATPAVAAASFGVSEGSLLALVGESGSGKTTLLRMLAGLEQPDQGTISLDGQMLFESGRSVAPEKRGIGMVFQHHALFPHLTVGKNIAFGLKKLPRPQRRERIDSLLELIDLPGFEERYPHELSGGERQRVALARALAPRPRLLLLDEPFSSLDARLRQTVRDETRAMLRKHGTTAIFVTHDTGDALTIADRIVVLRDGVIQQIGAPPEIYHSPANRYVASFFGTCNFLPFHSVRFTAGTRLMCHIGPTDQEGGVWVRPEDLELTPAIQADGESLMGSVRTVSFCGTHLDVTLDCHCKIAGPFAVTVRHQGLANISPGEIWAVMPRRVERA